MNVQIQLPRGIESNLSSDVTDEINEWMETGLVISDASAAAIASWFMTSRQGDSLTLFAHGFAVDTDLFMFHLGNEVRAAEGSDAMLQLLALQAYAVTAHAHEIRARRAILGVRKSASEADANL